MFLAPGNILIFRYKASIRLGAISLKLKLTKSVLRKRRAEVRQSSAKFFLKLKLTG